MTPVATPPADALVSGTTEALCTFCGVTPAARRGLCRACLRKLRECGLPVPPRLPRPLGIGSTPPLERLAVLVVAWPLAARRRLLAALLATVIPGDLDVPTRTALALALAPVDGGDGR